MILAFKMSINCLPLGCCLSCRTELANEASVWPSLGLYEVFVSAEVKGIVLPLKLAPPHIHIYTQRNLHHGSWQIVK